MGVHRLFFSMVFFYRFIVRLLGWLLLPLWTVLALWDVNHFRRRLALSRPTAVDSRRSVLIHGASLGEMAIVKKIIPLVREARPGQPIIVSVTTYAGYHHILETMQQEISHAVFLPLEFPFSIRRMLAFAKPELIIITETELWPNFLLQAKASGARMILLNGRISDRTLPTYRRFRSLFGPVLRGVHWIGVQSQEYRNRFIELGAVPESVVVTGNLKEAMQLPDNPEALREQARAMLGLSAEHWLFIAASTRPGEEEEILSAFVPLLQERQEMVLLLAPRHLSRLTEVLDCVRASRLPFIERSKMSGPLPPGVRVIVLDTLGELAGCYHAGEAAFVGGTLVDIGGHNLLEPLHAGLPVAFGPSVHQQKGSAEKLLLSGAGVQVADGAALSAFALLMRTHPERSEAMRRAAQTLVQTGRNVLEENVSLIRRML